MTNSTLGRAPSNQISACSSAQSDYRDFRFLPKETYLFHRYQENAQQRLCSDCKDIGFTDNPLYTETRYNDKIRYNDNLTVTKLSLKR